MTLCDTGPLIALLDRRQTDAHGRCIAALPTLRTPLIVVWPVIAEAMYLAGKLGRWPLQELLWDRSRSAKHY